MAEIIPTADHCECPAARRVTAIDYFVTNPGEQAPEDRHHEPGQCPCTNDLQLYERDGKLLTLCSQCC